MKDGLGMERGNIFTREPWMYSESEKQERHTVEAEYPFYVEEVPIGPLQAAIELPNQFDVFINGIQAVPTGSYYKDRAFSLYDIKNKVKKGENLIRIKTGEYGVLMNIESIYIVGSFTLKKVDDKYFICERQPISIGNIVNQGYPYYSGKIEYKTEVAVNGDYGEAYLEFGKFYGVTATVMLNGERIAAFGWPPYKADVTGKLKNGSNTVVIEITNSLQNLLGPFGLNANQHLVHPGSFYSDKHDIFFPAGFEGEAIICLEAFNDNFSTGSS
jgi:hypothetical protein